MQNADEEQIECKQTAFLFTLMNAARGKGMFGREGRVGESGKRPSITGTNKISGQGTFYKIYCYFSPSPLCAFWLTYTQALTVEERKYSDAAWGRDQTLERREVCRRRGKGGG